MLSLFDYKLYFLLKLECYLLPNGFYLGTFCENNTLTVFIATNNEAFWVTRIDVVTESYN